MGFKKANKEKAFARIAEFSLSGGGKTFTALTLATGFIKHDPRMQGKRIAVIDTEYNSASKYSHMFDFDVDNVTNYSIDSLCNSLESAASSGYGVIIIDSMSHSWHELLSEVEELAKAKYRGNTWSAWSEGTPKQKRLIRMIQTFPGHLIATMRASTEWNQEKDEKSGRIKPIRIGLKPEAGKGIEYEFDLLLEFNSDHYCSVIKDRTGGPFQDKIIHKPGEEFAKEISDWLNTGSEPTVVNTPVEESMFEKTIKNIKIRLGDERFFEEIKKLGITEVGLASITDRTKQIEIFTTLNGIK